MTRQKLIDFCLTCPADYEDYPFDSIADARAWTVMRHRTNKKSFVLIYERNAKLCVNLKCEPLEADFLRQAFANVTPAYHMNKVHWNTVTLDGDVPEDKLKRMIGRSYDLIKPKVRKVVSEQIFKTRTRRSHCISCLNSSQV
ncbi:MAG: MmcQ/YjbR family DNA-binding protein [Candidatus Gastranaerophilaceae bacterium]|jgi:predicted DNA-binding protein (MmcQ/YjbR family)